MKLFGWIRGKDSSGGTERRRWREAWTEAVVAEDGSRAAALRAQLNGLPLGAGDDNEVELEMIDALERLALLAGETAAGALPVVETQHRVLGGDRCHFTAPASLPEDPSQPSGRVLFTGARTFFVGGSQTQPVAWHAVRDVLHAERDVVLVRADGTAAAHFRFNSYCDAVAAAFLARRLRGAKGTRTL